MKVSDKDWQYWFGWYVAYGLAAGLFIVAVTNSDLLRGLACGGHDGNCFRDWMSALGGWAALAVGLPTLLALKKQVNDAEAFHRQNAAINLRRLRTLAQKARIEAARLEEMAKASGQVWNNPSMRIDMSPEGISSILSEYKILKDYVDRAEFRSVETEIEAPTQFSHEMIMRRVLNETQRLEESKAAGKGMPPENIRAWMQFINEDSEKYARYLIDACNGYLAETDKIIENAAS